MLSIIICSRTKTLNTQLTQNIAHTIGCLHELIVIDNSANKYSIFEAYNLGIQRSSGEFLCFVHEDVLFHTEGWGIVIQRIFNLNQEYGLLGVAGSSHKTRTPSGWWDCKDKYKSINIIQHYPNGKSVKEQYGFENSVLNEVVFVDGVFLALRKKIDIVFDEKLKGFHNYDFNISIETRKKQYKIGVTNQIELEHFSVGNLNNEWIKSIIEVHKYYRNFLPMHIGSSTDADAEVFSIKRLINYLLAFGGSKKTLFKYCFKLFLMEPLSKSNINLFKKVLKT